MQKNMRKEPEAAKMSPATTRVPLLFWCSDSRTETGVVDLFLARSLSSLSALASPQHHRRHHHHRQPGAPNKQLRARQSKSEAFPLHAFSLRVLTARHRDAIMGNIHGYWQRVCAQADGRDELQLQRVSSVAFGVAVSGRPRRAF